MDLRESEAPLAGALLGPLGLAGAPLLPVSTGGAVGEVIPSLLDNNAGRVNCVTSRHNSALAVSIETDVWLLGKENQFNRVVSSNLPCGKLH